MQRTVEVPHAQDEPSCDWRHSTARADEPAAAEPETSIPQEVPQEIPQENIEEVLSLFSWRVRAVHRDGPPHKFERCVRRQGNDTRREAIEASCRARRSQQTLSTQSESSWRGSRYAADRGRIGYSDRRGILERIVEQISSTCQCHK